MALFTKFNLKKCLLLTRTDINKDAVQCARSNDFSMLSIAYIRYHNTDIYTFSDRNAPPCASSMFFWCSIVGHSVDKRKWWRYVCPRESDEKNSI
jgi:hypothetical protein